MIVFGNQKCPQYPNDNTTLVMSVFYIFRIKFVLLRWVTLINQLTFFFRFIPIANASHADNCNYFSDGLEIITMAVVDNFPIGIQKTCLLLIKLYGLLGTNKNINIWIHRNTYNAKHVFDLETLYLLQDVIGKPNKMKLIKNLRILNIVFMYFNSQKMN